MGAKKPTTRILPTGERVTHHPDGRLVLNQTNTLADTLHAAQEDLHAANDAQRQALLDTIADKRDRQAAGDAVPTDKSAC